MPETRSRRNSLAENSGIKKNKVQSSKISQDVRVAAAGKPSRLNGPVAPPENMDLDTLQEESEGEKMFVEVKKEVIDHRPAENPGDFSGKEEKVKPEPVSPGSNYLIDFSGELPLVEGKTQSEIVCYTKGLFGQPLALCKLGPDDSPMYELNPVTMTKDELAARIQRNRYKTFGESKEGGQYILRKGHLKGIRGIAVYLPKSCAAENPEDLLSPGPNRHRFVTRLIVDVQLDDESEIQTCMETRTTIRRLGNKNMMDKYILKAYQVQSERYLSHGSQANADRPSIVPWPTPSPEPQSGSGTQGSGLEHQKSTEYSKKLRSRDHIKHRGHTSDSENEF